MESESTKKASHDCVVHAPWSCHQATTNIEPTEFDIEDSQGCCIAHCVMGGEVAGLMSASPKLKNLVVRCYRAMHRQAWEEGETESELMDHINDVMSDHFGNDWCELVE